MAFVHTAHGLGQIVATSTVRGRTQHKVAGPGFEVWLDSAQVRTAEDGGLFSDMTDRLRRNKSQPVYHYDRIPSDHGEDLEDVYSSAPIHIERDASLGDINENNSTRLPYNPEPQYPADMWAHDSTIQPGDYEIDAEERLSPSDSLSFDSRGRQSFPAPDPKLFAKDAGIKDWWDEVSTRPSEKEDLQVWDSPEEYLRDHPVDEDETQRHKTHASLGPKYAAWVLTAGAEGDDSLSRFRRDPIAEITRLGYLWTGGVEDPAMRDYGRLVEADKMLREAAWADVRAKAQRLRREGRVHVLQKGPGTIYANVDGDHGTYTTMIAKTGNTQSIDKWACSCEWGRWAFQRRISYVGRLCSHGYASYLEMQSDQHTGNPGRFHAPRRTASAVDDFQDYVNDFRDGHVDMDAADNFITLPQYSPREDPFSADEVADIYDWARDNATEREPRNYKMPYYAAEGDLPKVLRTHPQSLTPDLIKVPRGEDPYFVDVTEDERETTGPDGIMRKEAGPVRDFIRNVVTKDKDQVSRQEALDWYASLQPHEKNWIRENHPDHYVVRMDNKANGFDSSYRHSYLVDALGNPYTPGGFWRTADETVPEDDETTTPATPTSTSAGESTGGLSDPSVQTPRVPEQAPVAMGAEAPAEQPQDEDPMGGFDLSSFTDLAGPVIDGISSFAGPIAEGIGGALSGLGRMGLRRTADPGDNDNGYLVPEGDLEHLRELSDEDPDFGHTDDQNREKAHLIDELRDEGFDVSQIVAAKNDDDCCEECCDGGDCDNCDCHCAPTREASYDAEGEEPEYGSPEWYAGVSKNLREHQRGWDKPWTGQYPGPEKRASYGVGNQGQGQPGGAFGQPGGASWADRAFSGSGPDPKYWFTTSEDLIDRGAEHIDEVDVTEGDGRVNDWPESERPAQGKKKASRFLFSGDDDMRDELLQSVGEELEGIGQYGQFLDEAQEVGDDRAAGAIQEAIDDEADHVENFTEALEHTAGMNDVVRRFQASGGGALATGETRGGFSDDAIAGQARKFLAKTAGRVYSLAEQRELVEESHPGGARNKPTEDDLAGTHYV